VIFPLQTTLLAKTRLIKIFLHISFVTGILIGYSAVTWDVLIYTRLYNIIWTSMAVLQYLDMMSGIHMYLNDILKRNILNTALFVYLIHIN